MMNIIKFVLVIVIFTTMTSVTWALEPWTFEKSYESGKISPNGFGLFSTGDLNGNGTKEMIITDFARFWEDNPTSNGFNLYVLEWQKNQLNVTFHKNWERSRKRITSAKKFELDRFVAYKAKQLITWKINNKILAETMPPFFAIEWNKDRYAIYDDQVWEGPGLENTVGSWALPWVTPSCYPGFALNKKQPSFALTERQQRECLVGIRDFSGHDRPKIVSVMIDEIIKDKKYKETLRVRDFSRGFAIEEQVNTSNVFGWWTQSSQDLVDRLKWQGEDGLLMAGYQPLSWYVFRLNKGKRKYELINLQNSRPLDVKAFSLPDVYLAETQSPNKHEYWGYRVGTASDGEDIWLLRKDDLAPDYSFVNGVDINFAHHEPFLGVGYFDVTDIDGDGIDEVIILETTGKRKIGEETTVYSDVKDYIQILKWDGQKYQTMWISPAYTKRGAMFMVDDIKNSGKKQVVVLTPDGTIQIWERQ